MTTSTTLVPTRTEAIPGIVAGMRAAFRSGRTRDLAWRHAQLDGLARFAAEREAELLAALAADLGKPAVEAWLSEPAFLLGELGFAQANLDAWAAPEDVPQVPGTPGRSAILRQPYGVALIVGPWNYPAQLVLLPLVGALAAGCVAVVKPSELAPATSAVLAEHLPRYVDGVAVVQGGVEETTALLAERFDVVFYTGNGRVGRVVMEAAARHLTPVVLELGGRSPAIVAADADLDVAAARIAGAKFLNAGQTCVAPDHVLVERAVAEPLEARLVDAVRRMYGDDPRRSPDFGRIVSERHTRRLRDLLVGAEIVTGGVVDVAARYVAPTIVRGLERDHPLLRDEIFGPILPIVAVDDLDDAVAHVDAGPAPLALYVFTGDEARAADVLARTHSGGACVNGALAHITSPFLPFGGVGESGTGAYHGRAGFEAFTHRRSVMWRDVAVDPPTQYPPYPPLGVLQQAIGLAR